MTLPSSRRDSHGPGPRGCSGHTCTPTAPHAAEAPSASISLSPSPVTAVEGGTQAALNATKTPALAVSRG